MKRFEISKETLQGPLALVSNIVDRKQTLPILGNIVLSKSGSELIALSTDLDLEISYRIDNITGDDFCLSVSSLKINDILRSLPPKSQIKFKWDEVSNMLHLSSGQSRYRLTTRDVKDFPRVKITDQCIHEFYISAKRLHTALSTPACAIAVNHSRKYLNGLSFQHESCALTTAATDAHRLAIYRADQVSNVLDEDIDRSILDYPFDINLAKNEDADPFAIASPSVEKTATLEDRARIILPRKSVNELIRLIDERHDYIKVSVYSKQIVFHLGDVLLKSKLIEGVYPEYERAVPQDLKFNLTFNREALLFALQRLIVTIYDRVRVVQVLINPNERIIIKAANNESEEAVEEIDHIFTGDQQCVLGFNADYVIDALTNIQCKEVVWHFGDVKKSTLIHGVKDTNYRYVLMPMSI